MLDEHKIVDRFANALEYGQRYTDPFLHYNYSPFAPDLYEEMLKYIPADDKAWVPSAHVDAVIPGGGTTRYLLPLSKERLQKVSAEVRDFWLELGAILACDALRDIFKRYLEPDLKLRWDCPVSEIPALPKPCLLRDYPGYRIRVHPDSRTKVMTTSHYLASDTSQRHLGTGFYELKEGNKFERIRKLEFLPNTGYCFAVTKKSWHDVDTMQENDKARHSLMMLYFMEEGHEY